MKRVEGTVEKIVAGGSGLVRVDGRAVLVPRVAPGDRVAIEIDGKRARLLKVLTPSPSRVEAPCAIFDRCGGCDLMHLSRDEQRRVRLAILREQLGDHEIVWHDASPAQGRTRARMHVKPFQDRVVVGFHATASNTILDLSACGALDPALLPALDDIRAILAGARGEGDVSIALGDGRKPVIVIDWTGDLPPTVYAESERRVNSGRLAGVQITIPGASSRIGDPRAVTMVNGAPMRAPPGGFAQASELGDRVLVELVTQRARASGLRVLELFAGSGNFTHALAREAAHVTAVEIDAAASTAARENLRDKPNVKMVVADADAYAIPKDVDVIVLDPPRSGARGAARAINDRKIKRVVYVSCEPSTLARDLQSLSNYAVESIDAVDLFPDTSHVETIATLKRK